MTASIQKVVTAVQLSLDGGTWDVENNVWLIGDEKEVLVIDAASIEATIDGRRVVAIVCTHAHNDHVNAAGKLAERTSAEIWLHPADDVLWRMVHPDRRLDRQLRDLDRFGVAGTVVQVLHTPGHAPGAVCLYTPELGAVFSGDMLFAVARVPQADRSVTSAPSSTRSATDC